LNSGRKLNARRLAVFLLWGRLAACAGLPTPPPVDEAAPPPVPKSAASTVIRDQAHILTSFSRLRAKDFIWLAPLMGSAAYLVESDQRNMTERLHTNPAARERSLTLSNAALGSLAAAPALLYWSGWRNANDYARDTSVLSARAVVDAALISEGLHLVTQRERPLSGGSSGDFLRGGALDSSFPSMHAGTAWALAAVLAERYPGWLTQTAAYSFASAVSLSRVTAGEHFPSDVLVGSALGWLIGHYVARTREPESIRSSIAPAATPAPADEKPASVGSSYVPLDSWIYPVLDRLSAMGLIPSQASGLRPWTRDECRRQLLVADDNLASSRLDSGAARVAQELIASLHRELDTESNGRSTVALDSIYVRNGFIAGTPLNDSFHFGQTWIGDYGRPYGQGWNSYEGFTAHAGSGRFFAFVQGEYQHAPGQAGYSLPVRETIANLDGNPLQAASVFSSTNRFRAIEAYAGVRWGDVQLSIGKQALWWGPGYDSPLSFGNNAEPTENFKASLIHPIRLPGVLRHLGEIRGEFVVGKLGGQMYTWRPWFNAQKLSFKLTDNLELGFTRWSLFWGAGHPITLDSLISNFTSTASLVGQTGAKDPGDRKGGFDFRYRVPGLRNWLTLYADSYSDDDPSPLAAPRRAAIDPGIYLTHVPGLPRLDFRVEAPSTELLGIDQGGTFIYYNDQYHSGNTNYGHLLGNAVGRDGRAIEGWSRYWFSPRTRVELGYRQLKGSAKFLPGGSTQSDATMRASFAASSNSYVDVMLQYERFWVPALGGPRRNMSGWVQLRWEPKLESSR
jgi:hypothetical protein